MAGPGVNAYFLMLTAALGALPDGVATSDTNQVTRTTVYAPSAQLAAAVRGQSYDEGPVYVPPSAAPQQLPQWDPNQMPPPANNYGYDPFLGQAPVMNSAPTLNSGFGIGTVGPQPYRFGWGSYYDVGYLPDSAASGGRGDFQIFEFNAAWRKTMGLPADNAPNWIFSWTPQFNLRNWTGPDLVPLPGHVYRFGSDFELATPANNPWSVQLGFTPALVSDFESSLSRDSFNFDARAVLFFRTSQQWMFALGAAYWDRVDGMVIPYAGVVWTPNDRWELRLMFPKSRISYFVGNVWGAATWLYGGVEYTAEAYQIGMPGVNKSHERIQLTDYRAVFGARAEKYGVMGFVEAGWVFDRDVKFKYGTPGFDIGTGFFGRMGVRF